jgi:hypothetical protein
MKPSAVVVILPERAGVDASLDASPDTAAVVDEGNDSGSRGEPTLSFNLDLGINDRWAAVDKALAKVRASLSKGSARRRAA